MPMRVGVRRQARQVVHGGQKRLSVPDAVWRAVSPSAAAFILNSCLVIQWFLEVEPLLFGAGSACVASAWTGNLGSLGNLEVWDLCRVSVISGISRVKLFHFISECKWFGRILFSVTS